MPLIWHILFLLSAGSDTPGIILDGGIGVGRVTKAGLPVPVGEAAINPVPRKMILTTVQQTLEEFKINRGVKVVISVPAGEEIAKKTLNGRLGLSVAFPFSEQGALSFLFPVQHIWQVLSRRSVLLKLVAVIILS